MLREKNFSDIPQNFNMGRKKLTDEEKAVRKAERNKKKGLVEEVKEEVKEIAEKVVEAGKEEAKDLTGEGEEKEFPETDIGIDVFSQH